MKGLRIFTVLSLLALLPISVFATTWKVTVSEPERISYQLWAQTSAPTEYPVVYFGVGYVGSGYATLDLTMWIDKDGRMTAKSITSFGAVCNWTGQLDKSKTAATGTMICAGAPSMGWDAIVYQN